jgi:hypothetical protein
MFFFKVKEYERILEEQTDRLNRLLVDNRDLEKDLTEKENSVSEMSDTIDDLKEQLDEQNERIDVYEKVRDFFLMN